MKRSESADARLAESISFRITRNCEDYHAGTLTHAEWSLIQHDLWAEASKALVMRRVMALVCPSTKGVA